MQKNEIGSLIKDFNIKPETIEFLEENIREMLLHMAFVMIFGYDIKKQTTEEKNQTKKLLLHSTGNINKMKRQPAEWEKYLQIFGPIWG